jgi:hypothetical protein
MQWPLPIGNEWARRLDARNLEFRRRHLRVGQHSHADKEEKRHNCSTHTVPGSQAELLRSVLRRAAPETQKFGIGWMIISQTRAQTTAHQNPSIPTSGPHSSNPEILKPRACAASGRLCCV